MLRVRYGKQALSAMYRTIVGRRDAGESGVTPDFMAEALAERELATGTPEWSAARLTAFKVSGAANFTRSVWQTTASTAWAITLQCLVFTAGSCVASGHLGCFQAHRECVQCQMLQTQLAEERGLLSPWCPATTLRCQNLSRHSVVHPQHFLRLAGTALSSVGVLDYDADAGNELSILERGQNEQVT